MRPAIVNVRDGAAPAGAWAERMRPEKASARTAQAHAAGIDVPRIMRFLDSRIIGGF